MQHRSIHQGPVLRIFPWEGLIVAGVALGAIAVVALSGVAGVGALLDQAVASLAAALTGALR